MQSPVPGLVQSLNALSRLLDKGLAHAEAKKIKPEVLPQLRLIADMLPLQRQITIASDHAKGMAARLAGVDVPSFADTETSVEELKERIAKTVAFIQSIPEAAFADAENRTIVIRTGGREVSFPATQYYQSYALPNFYFHAAMTHAILRANGVDVGKSDFLGV